LPALLYGEGHAYSNPLTGSGTEESVARITRDDLVDFHRTWFRPGNAQLIVVGDVTLDELLPKLERLFAEWDPDDVPSKNIGEVSGGGASVVYLLDRPDAVQSLIIGGSLIVPKANPDEVAIETVNNILGGTFTSRVNMNLREDKHWAYGAFTFIPDTKAQRPMIVYAPVQTDRTAESLRELLAELRGILGPEPITSEELSKVQELETRSMAGRWETNGEVQGGITEIVTFGLPDDYYERYGRQLRALGLAELSAAAREIIVPDGFVWVVVGDRAAIEGPIRELGLGPIHLIDADGRVIDEAAASR